MGQGFDRDCNVLGEAYCNTNSEVFKELIKEFPLAHEIRVKSMQDKFDAEVSKLREAAKSEEKDE